MSESNDIKRCKFCKKALIDEKIPICLRCRLTGKKKAAKPVVGIAAISAGVLSIHNNRSNTEDEEE